MFRRYISPVSAAVGLAISLSITTVTLPFVNAAKADQTTGFGLRLNLMSIWRPRQRPTFGGKP